MLVPANHGALQFSIYVCKLLLYSVTDCSGAQNKYCMIQYYFDGPEIEVKIKPHGNAKSDMPFFRTTDSARKVHKDIAAKNKPKDALVYIQARGLSSLPRIIGSRLQTIVEVSTDKIRMFSTVLCWSAKLLKVCKKHLYRTLRQPLIHSAFSSLTGRCKTWSVS